LLDFDIDFFFSANVGAPLLGLVDFVDSREVGDVVNICVILVLVGDDDEGTFVRLDMGRDVGDVVAMIVGDVVVDVVGARKILAKTSSFSMLDYVCWIKFHLLVFWLGFPPRHDSLIILRSTIPIRSTSIVIF
jgi:hypothetical protein